MESGGGDRLLPVHRILGSEDEDHVFDSVRVEISPAEHRPADVDVARPDISPTFVARRRRFVPWRCFAPFRAEACWL
ncbi:MAG: hypothetical protein CME06_04315, partial [Gemmatimonadetes bacterium]|nr:hypothetical protein [Gemmatimonadota bacterium]